MNRDRRRARNDGGYALVAAVTAVAAFGYMAFQVLAADRGAIAIVAARMEQAKLSAAADAGIALALHGLASDDRGSRWSIDGRMRRVGFQGVTLSIVVEDERGKAPIAGLNDGQARALFAGAGAKDSQLEALVDEFRDWQTDYHPAPDEVTGKMPPPPSGPPVRHGPFRTVDELAALKDMDASIYARIKPVVTVFFEESGPFEASHAAPLAKAAMSADSLASPEQMANDTAENQNNPEEDLAPDDHYVGRTLTVRVTARSRAGASFSRSEIVELTGDHKNPYWIRYVD